MGPDDLTLSQLDRDRQCVFSSGLQGSHLHWSEVESICCNGILNNSCREESVSPEKPTASHTVIRTALRLSREEVEQALTVDRNSATLAHCIAEPNRPSPADDESGEAGMFAELEDVFREINDVTRRELQPMLDTILECDQVTPYALTAIAEVLRDQGRYAMAMKCCRFAVAFDYRHQTNALSRCNSYASMAECYKALGQPQEQELWLRKAYDLADKEPLSIYTAYGIAQELYGTLQAQGRQDEAANWASIAESLMKSKVEWLTRRRRER